LRSSQTVAVVRIWESAVLDLGTTSPAQKCYSKNCRPETKVLEIRTSSDSPPLCSLPMSAAVVVSNAFYALHTVMSGIRVCPTAVVANGFGARSDEVPFE